MKDVGNDSGGRVLAVPTGDLDCIFGDSFGPGSLLANSGIWWVNQQKEAVVIGPFLKFISKKLTEISWTIILTEYRCWNIKQIITMSLQHLLWWVYIPWHQKGQLPKSIYRKKQLNKKQQLTMHSHSVWFPEGKQYTINP